MFPSFPFAFPRTTFFVNVSLYLISFLFFIFYFSFPKATAFPLAFHDEFSLSSGLDFTVHFQFAICAIHITPVVPFFFLLVAGTHGSFYLQWPFCLIRFCVVWHKDITLRYLVQIQTLSAIAHYKQINKDTNTWLVVWLVSLSTFFGSYYAELSHFDKSFKVLSLV